MDEMINFFAVAPIIPSPRFPTWNSPKEKEVQEAIPVSDSGSGSVTSSSKINKAESQAWISGHNLTYPLKHSFREIITRSATGLQRAPLTKINESLYPTFLEVPPFDKGPTNASHMISGIQTTISRLDASIPQLARWLANTGAKLCVVLLESERVMVNPDQMLGLQTRMHDQGFDVTLYAAKEGDSFPQRYFSLVSLIYWQRTLQTQWISLIDDDTFFPSMPALTSMLAEHDSTKQQYIGSLSGDWWAVAQNGMMAFGGAAVFLSIPLAQVIDSNKETCGNNLRSSAGDTTLMDCIYIHSSTKLTHVVDLNQADMHGDVSGFYESGRKHLSLHYWKSGSVFGTGLPMAAMHLVADVCGECFLQRFQFGDVVLTSGYSIAVYPKGHANQVDMDKLEETWSSNMNTKHSLGPTRPRLELEVEKVQYSFQDAVATNAGVRQLYLHKGVAGQPDSVVELLWRQESPVSKFGTIGQEKRLARGTRHLGSLEKSPLDNRIDGI
ncbi:hypothetical protein MMC30_004488 [Trapelia coarctata]|nr:hypothetical protein [Trapelia coarctata]